MKDNECRPNPCEAITLIFGSPTPCRAATLCTGLKTKQRQSKHPREKRILELEFGEYVRKAAIPVKCSGLWFASTMSLLQNERLLQCGWSADPGCARRKKSKNQLCSQDSNLTLNGSVFYKNTSMGSRRPVGDFSGANLGQQCVAQCHAGPCCPQVPFWRLSCLVTATGPLPSFCPAGHWGALHFLRKLVETMQNGSYIHLATLQTCSWLDEQLLLNGSRKSQDWTRKALVCRVGWGGEGPGGSKTGCLRC